MAAPVIRGNSFYTLITSQSWNTSEQLATGLGGHLATINDLGENEFLLKSFNQYNQAFIGYSDHAHEGQWIWSDGSTSTFTKWQAGEPNNGAGVEDYAVLYLAGGYPYEGMGNWNDGGEQNGWAAGGIAEIPLTSSIAFSTTPKEGAGEFTTSINLSAGTQSTGNLVEGAHVYWKITGIQQSDLTSGYSLTGDAYITNGKLDIKEALVQDNIQESETLSFSVYSDSDFTQQIGTTVSSVIQDSIKLANLDIGSTTTTASKTTTLASTISRLILTGTGNINGTGNAMNNFLTGNDGNNILDGGAGNDILAGDKGNDTYIVDSIYDSIIENANEGIDLVKSSVSWTLGANVENLTLTGTESLTGTGNALNNTIIGNGGNNVLDGEVGNDTLEGSTGDDILIGGLGNDVMKGGSGNDTYYVDSTGDTIMDTSGTDTVVASISWTLDSKLENLTLTGTDALTGIGNTRKNTIIGNSGNNVLDGLGGTDVLTGGSGADAFRFSTRPNFGSSTADHITDFNGTEGDGIEIRATLLGLTMGPTVKLGLSLTTVSSAADLTTALGSASTFVYDSSSGSLYWNQNGTKSGFGSGGIFAVLDNHAALNTSNISLV